MDDDIIITLFLLIATSHIFLIIKTNKIMATFEEQKQNLEDIQTSLQDISNDIARQGVTIEELKTTIAGMGLTQEQEDELSQKIAEIKSSAASIAAIVPEPEMQITPGVGSENQGQIEEDGALPAGS